NAQQLNSNTTTETTAAHWDWKRHALTVPLEAFVMCVLEHFTFPLLPHRHYNYLYLLTPLTLGYSIFRNTFGEF
ncbi:hypothetical protein, partial [Vibrio cholerae]|uniref:hypothetical protein n=1 Tax=Vibrio cholerae TaxID=666 RepID=UPI00215F2CE9